MKKSARWFAVLSGCLAAQFAGATMAVSADGKNAANAPIPFEARMIQSGHSLTDPIPEPLAGMIRASGGLDATIARSTIPGSPMEWRWKNAPGYGLPDARKEIGNYQVLVLTERVSLSNTVQWHHSNTEALRWFNHAWENGDKGRGAKTILYATWVEIDSGPEAENPYKDPEGNIPWRERLPLEFARWEEMVAYVNANRPEGSPAMRLIPGPLIFAEVYDQIAAGTAPGLTDISQLFFDNIHVNDSGAYLIALAHFAVIFGRDPRGLPNRVGLKNPPSPETAAWMQDLVWRIVTTYKGTGVVAK